MRAVHKYVGPERVQIYIRAVHKKDCSHVNLHPFPPSDMVFERLLAHERAFFFFRKRLLAHKFAAFNFRFSFLRAIPETQAGEDNSLQSDGEIQDESLQLSEDIQSPQSDGELQDHSCKLGDEQGEQKSIVSDGEIEHSDSQLGVQQLQNEAILTSPKLQEEDSEVSTKNQQRKSMVCDGMQPLQQPFDGAELQNSADESQAESPKTNKKRRLCLRRKRPKALGRGVPANYVAETADTLSQERKMNASEKLDLLFKEVTAEKEREK